MDLESLDLKIAQLKILRKQVSAFTELDVCRALDDMLDDTMIERAEKITREKIRCSKRTSRES
jgi:hypothetical protein